MRLLVLVFVFLGLLGCNSGGGGGGHSFGQGKVVTTPLSSEQKASFVLLLGSHGRAQNAYMRLGYPKDKSTDETEMKMYELLLGAGCKYEKVPKKTGDTYIVEESIASSGCPVNYFQHIEATETKAIVSQKYLALTDVYKMLNDVVGITLDAESRIAGRNAAAEGTGKISSKAYGELPYYIFGTIQSTEDGKNGKIRTGLGVQMPFGLVQIVGTTTTVDGKTTAEIEINGEKIDKSTSPELIPFRKLLARYLLF
ncbi:MAG: hypothetical protein A4S09_13140 [Proteobacteria bacterium SG_bin7]|nr:MAG: hypothetical protein A4S09_13140 [Proteobacteria bacterium SG_bin7]